MEHSNMTISGLVNDKTIKVASLPPANWREIDDAAPCTLPLIAEDYPAKTAVMWNAAYEKIGMPDHNSMVLADPTQVGLILQAFRNDSRYMGGGAGVGFKEAVVPYLDDITPLAKAMGAVNIIKKTVDGRLAGDNTDGAGYVQSLEQILSQQGKQLKGAEVLMLGAGGSGRAISFALAQKGARLTILNRTEAKAEELAKVITAFIGSDVATGGGRRLLPEAFPLQDAIVSVIDDAHSPLDEYSPLGDMDFPVTPDSIKKNQEQTAELLRRAKPGLVVSDIRIRSKETPMLAQAHAYNLPVLNGIPMVVNQGVAAFWWVYQDKLEALGIRLADVEEIMWRVAKL
jgi:shikimate 5-dehydrogenase